VRANGVSFMEDVGQHQQQNIVAGSTRVHTQAGCSKVRTYSNRSVFRGFRQPIRPHSPESAVDGSRRWPLAYQNTSIGFCAPGSQAVQPWPDDGHQRVILVGVTVTLTRLTLPSTRPA
jgi:hypothetical protein